MDRKEPLNFSKATAEPVGPLEPVERYPKTFLKLNRLKPFRTSNGQLTHWIQVRFDPISQSHYAEIYDDTRQTTGHKITLPTLELRDAMTIIEEALSDRGLI